jgi:hypothetical protein
MEFSHDQVSLHFRILSWGNSERGVQFMKSTLAALLVGVAVLSSAGSALAADAVRADVQNKAATDGILRPSAPMASTNAQTETATIGHSQARGPVVLTDAQMKDVTAGHYTGYLHYGPYYYWSYFWANWVYGGDYWHY